MTQQLYYISGGDGMAAVLVKTGSQQNIYYAHTDHLGSIISLTGDNGSPVFKAEYDAWGKQTITNNTFKFHRGYTGHEHLPEFGLINMNGRMYDPLLGRFLSPDPFVQSPDYSQNFNRYSYCLNNPLIYTDPSGEFFFLIPNIGWSKSEGLSVGLTAIVGIPGILSAQAGIGYSFKSNDFSATVGATAAFNTLYASYSTQSGFSTGWSAGLSPQIGFPISTNFFSTGANYNITQKSWSGNVSAWGVDKNGWTFNPSFSVMVYPEHTTNWARGKGFHSNDKVLENFIWGRYDKDWSNDIGSEGANWYNDALNYFGFEGTYDPSQINPGGFNKENGAISFNSVAFSRNFDYLKAIYMEEKFHSRDYKYGESIAPKDANPHEYEEWRAQKYLYRNQGLFRKSGESWVNRIDFRGGRAGIYENIVTPTGNYSTSFVPKWWHKPIYRIPRKW